MPRPGLALLATLAAALPALAQAPQPPAGQPAPPPGGAVIPTPGAGAPPGVAPGGIPQPAPAIDPALMAHLNAWEKVMKGANNFFTECTKVEKDSVLRKEAAYTGSILCLKPNMARMNLQKKPAPGQKPDPNDLVGIICTGKEVYEYNGLAKEVTVYKLPNGGVGDNLLLEFMSGALTAQAVAARFDLKQLQPNDPNYLFLEIRPRLARDKTDFESMILVLFKPDLPAAPGMGYLPRTVVLRKSNGQKEETWDFPRPAVNVGGIKAEAFQYVKPPPDWKVQPAQPTPGAPGTPTGQPRVARPMGP